jgi:peptidoglycan/LPS O-acetylase OafA/YrhL
MSRTGSYHSLPVLDGLRATSILLVLACHLLPLGPKALRLNEMAGAMGMSLFFALSGFLITSGLITNANVHEFVVRRFARILPLAYAYTAVVFLVFTFQPQRLLYTDAFTVNYLTQYLDSGWTAHMWSLCVEVHFYLAIALAVLVSGKRGLWIVWPACLGITFLRVSTGTYISLATHLRGDEILAGACAATAFGYIGLPCRSRSLLAAMGLLAFLWALSSHPLSGWLQYIRPYTTALLLLAALQYGAVNPGNVLESRPLRYIATISFALYVIHPATAHGWMSEGGVMAKYFLKRPISFALTFLLAHFSTFYWERPWQVWAKRWIQKRREFVFAQIARQARHPIHEDAAPRRL